MNGARLTLTIGPFSGQPSELLKVILVVFLAGYLSENRPLLVEESTRIGPSGCRRCRTSRRWSRCGRSPSASSIVQRDLGAALLFFAVFLLLLYVATARVGYVVVGLVPFVVGASVLYFAVRPRPDPGRHLARPVRGPDRRRLPGRPGAATRSRAAGCSGPGSGRACRRSTAGCRSRRSTRTSRSRRSARSSGLVGILAILGLYLVVVERGLRIAASAADEFRALLAAGLALVIGVQAFIIAAGNLKLIPLTGITLPFISYGGSSLLANAVVVGLLLALSDRGVEPPPPPGRRAVAAPDRGLGRLPRRPAARRRRDRAARRPHDRPAPAVAILVRAAAASAGRSAASAGLAVAFAGLAARRRLLAGGPVG